MSRSRAMKSPSWPGAWNLVDRGEAVLRAADGPDPGVGFTASLPSEVSP